MYLLVCFKPVLWMGIVFFKPIRIRLSILIAMQNQDPDPKIGKSEFFSFNSRQCQFTLYYLSHQCHRCQNFHKFGQHIEIVRKIFYFIYLVKIDADPDPDRKALDTDPDPAK